MKRIWLILLAGVATMFLIGWGEKKIELLDDKKLIDLSKAIEYAKPGGDWQENSDNREQQNNEDNAETDSRETDEQESVEEKDQIIVISIRDEEITYDGTKLDDITELKQMIERDYKENVSFRLVDDWAETHIYKAALQILSNLHAEIGITYSVS